jgi:DNA-binding NarL/FixJ family response regulator
METIFPVTVLIASPEGILSSALCTFLETLPGVQVIARPTSQAETLRDLVNFHPRLLLLDCGLNSDRQQTSISLQSFITQIHALAPEVHTIAIVNDLRQKQLALNVGISQAILKGTYDQPLCQAVECISLSFRSS